MKSCAYIKGVSMKVKGLSVSVIILGLSVKEYVLSIVKNRFYLTLGWARNLVLLLVLWLVSVAFAQAIPPDSPALRPFGSHPQAYTAGVLKPSQAAAQLDATTKTFYDKWKANYLTNAECGLDRYYVRFLIDGSVPANGSISVSEGQGYGMLIMALMAGYEPHAQGYFDGMYRMFRDHPSVSGPDLMAWEQVHGCGNTPDGGDTDATDGDLDIAFALLLADKQWGSLGTINYLAEGKKVISAIAARDVEPVNNYLFLGSSESNPASYYYSGTRPSDFTMDHFRAFSTAIGGANVWGSVLNKSYSILSYVQTKASPIYGLVPDFIAGANTTTPTPAPITRQNGVMMYLESPQDNAYYANACRVPWRLATDYLVSGEPRAKAIVTRLNTGIQTITRGNIANLTLGYQLDGTSINPTWSDPQMFTAPLAVAAMLGSDQAWMDAVYNKMVNTPSTKDYYSDTLTMLALLVVSNNWWAPSSVNSSDCVFNWAEKTYPSLLAPPASSITNLPYYYRYYSGANAYLGVSSADRHVYYYAAGLLRDVGALSDWLPVAGCQ